MDEIFLTVMKFIMDLSMNYPVVTTVLAILYCAGMAFQAIQDIADKYVLTTATPSDNEWLAKLKEKKLFKIVKLFFAYVLRIKV